MKALAAVDAGICGFQTRIHADSDDTQNVTFKAMQVAAGVAMPKDVTLKIATEQFLRLCGMEDIGVLLKRG